MNRTVSIVRYAKLESGWRRGAVVMTPNGKIKHPYMIQGGVEVSAPQGRYQLLKYEGKRSVYTDLGNNPTEALSLFKAAHDKARKHTAAIEAAEAAGLDVVKPTGAKFTNPQGQNAKAMRGRLPDPA
jgi:hypothetical protein